MKSKLFWFTALGCLLLFLTGCSKDYVIAENGRKIKLVLPTSYGVYVEAGNKLSALSATQPVDVTDFDSSSGIIIYGKNLNQAGDKLYRLILVKHRDWTKATLTGWDSFLGGMESHTREVQSQLSGIPNEAESLPLLTKPVQGQPEMIYLMPTAPLSPGVYVLPNLAILRIDYAKYLQSLPDLAEQLLKSGDYRNSYDTADAASSLVTGDAQVANRMRVVKGRCLSAIAEDFLKTGKYKLSRLLAKELVAQLPEEQEFAALLTTASFSHEALDMAATGKLENAAAMVNGYLETAAKLREEATKKYPKSTPTFHSVDDVIRSIISNPNGIYIERHKALAKKLVELHDTTFCGTMVEALNRLNNKPNVEPEDYGNSPLYIYAWALGVLDYKPAGEALRGALSNIASSWSNVHYNGIIETFAKALATLDQDQRWLSFYFYNQQWGTVFAETLAVGRIAENAPNPSKLQRFFDYMRPKRFETYNRDGLFLNTHPARNGIVIESLDKILVTCAVTRESDPEKTDRSGLRLFDPTSFFRITLSCSVLEQASGKSLIWGVYDMEPPRLHGNVISYSNGDDIPKDSPEALLRRAAEQGDAGAQYNLGNLYSEGDGVPKDNTEAMKWYHMAAEQGHVGALFNLGVSYSKGYGVPKDSTEAVKWYRKAAEHGDAEAQYVLAGCFANGFGMPKDFTEAVKWYRTAAAQGHENAQYYLGYCYANGDGVAMDNSEAVNLWRKIAEKGHVGAQYNLGVAYANGYGILKDSTEAVKWYRKAAEQGHAKAKTSLSVILKEIEASKH